MRSAARRQGATLRRRSRRRCARRTAAPARARAAAGGRTGRARDATVARASPGPHPSRTGRRFCIRKPNSASSPARFGRPPRVGVVGCPGAERAASASRTGTSPSMVATRPSLAIHRRGGIASAAEMPVVSATAVCAARTSVVRGRDRWSRSGGRCPAGRSPGRRCDHAGDLTRDVEVHRTLRLQHAHQFARSRSRRETGTGTHLGNVAHCASR